MASTITGSMLPFPKFILRALRLRTATEEFGRAAKNYADLTSSPNAFAQQLVSPALRFSVHPDPLMVDYIVHLANRHIIPLSSVLHAMLHVEKSSPDGNLGSFNEILFLAFQRELNAVKPRAEDIFRVRNALEEWMDYFLSIKNKVEGAHALSLIHKCTLDALVQFMLAFGEHTEVGPILRSKQAPKPKQFSFSSKLSLFTTFMNQLYNPMIVSRLEAAYHIPTETTEDGTGVPGLMLGNNMLMPDGVVEGDMDSGPLARGAIYAWINAVFIGRPLIDNDILTGYLHNRYKTDVRGLICDFIIAILDNISCAISRGESAAFVFILRSFLSNKVPLLLSGPWLAIPPLEINDWLQYALSRVDSGSLYNISASRADPLAKSGRGADLFALPVDVRQEFLFACVLHNVLEEGAIQGILGDLPSQAGASQKLYEQDLARLFQQDPDKIEVKMEEIGTMEGNSGAVVRAVVQTMQSLCHNRETITLRTICSYLIRKPPFLDVIFLFEKPETLLKPLYQLLDNFQLDEDDQECQPVYEEFGYILLLVLTIMYRYDLKPDDYGGVFVPQLFKKVLLANSTISDDAENRRKTEGWIKELFEEQGVSNALMSSCQPQEFYNIVPNIISDTLLAAHEQQLNLQALHSGIQYFLQPFLLPSLLGVLSWLCNHLWETSESQKLKLPLEVLQALVLPPSLSEEARPMHQTVVSLAAPIIDRTLRQLIHTDANLTAAEKILSGISPYINTRRVSKATQRELESWTGSGQGGMLGALRSSVSGLVVWSASQDMNASPPFYSHKLILTCCTLSGSRAVVRALIDEVVKFQAQSPLLGDYAIDVAASVLSAPTADDFSRRVERNTQFILGEENDMNSNFDSSSRLLDELKVQEETAIAKSPPKDPFREAIVRVRRRVTTLVQPYVTNVVNQHPDLNHHFVADVHTQMVPNVGLGGMGDMAGMHGEGTGGGLMDGLDDDDLLGGGGANDYLDMDDMMEGF
ncbi:Med5-domain-containing protein [Ascobolus immersus RN42]|uniref:Mediator of RNA polymerase II transcription subunit 5 n=1 Tax=Ascobolus immersus RN42 TaxID=1160509 RepID=A0A3N4HQB4_ASCIM|nr:Med5-domain-containing protein [Ascobolus immersus RN42]